MKKLIIVAFALFFALAGYADDNMNTNTNTGAEGAATTQTHHRHKKHERKMKKAHHKTHETTAPSESTGGANQGAPAGTQ